MALQARSIMQSHVVSVSPHDPLSNVQRLFFEEEINGAPVIDDDTRVLGVITSRDLLRAAAEEHDSTRGDPGYFRELLEISGPDFMDAPDGFLERLSERTVSEFMTTSLVTVPPDASVAEVARTLRTNHVHRVLVVEGKRLQGIISSFDLVSLLEKS